MPDAPTTLAPRCHAVTVDKVTEVVYACELPIAVARDLIIDRFRLRFVLRESMFWGGDYYLAEAPTGRVMIHANADIVDEASIEDDAAESSTIVRVSIPDLSLGDPFRPLS